MGLSVRLVCLRCLLFVCGVGCSVKWNGIGVLVGFVNGVGKFSVMLVRLDCVLMLGRWFGVLCIVILYGVLLIMCLSSVVVVLCRFRLCVVLSVSWLLMFIVYGLCDWKVLFVCIGLLRKCFDSVCSDVFVLVKWMLLCSVDSGGMLFVDSVLLLNLSVFLMCVCGWVMCCGIVILSVSDVGFCVLICWLMWLFIVLSELLFV